jgi:hypothetical protein
VTAEKLEGTVGKGSLLRSGVFDQYKRKSSSSCDGMDKEEGSELTFDSFRERSQSTRSELH